MAAKSTVFKCSLQIADMDRHYYQTHSLTVARHPSETDERMMLRLLAFALYADENLQFGQGMTNDEEADLWLKDLTGTIDLWIDMGLPDERLVRKACGRAGQVVIFAYGGRGVDIWFTQNEAQLARQQNLTVLNIAYESSQTLARLAQRNMNLQCLIQDGQVSFSDAALSVEVEMTRLQSSAL